MDDSIESLWDRYRSSGDPMARAQLLDRFLGLVHHAARQLARRISRDVEIDDLIGAGTLGLVQALEGFDPARGLAFSTYAVPRIRGAMLDELRSRDWLPRSLRARSRRLAAARESLQHRFGRRPSNEELARALGIDVPALWRWQEELDARVVLPLDAGGDDGEDGWGRLGDGIADRRAVDPGEALDEADLVGRFHLAFERLPARDRLVLTLHCYEHLSLRQIGEVLHVSESRVSQIRTRAIGRLRESVNDVRVAA